MLSCSIPGTLLSVWLSDHVYSSLLGLYRYRSYLVAVPSSGTESVLVAADASDPAVSGVSVPVSSAPRVIPSGSVPSDSALVSPSIPADSVHKCPELIAEVGQLYNKYGVEQASRVCLEVAFAGRDQKIKALTARSSGLTLRLDEALSGQLLAEKEVSKLQGVEAALRSELAEACRKVEAMEQKRVADEARFSSDLAKVQSDLEATRSELKKSHEAVVVEREKVESSDRQIEALQRELVSAKDEGSAIAAAKQSLEVSLADSQSECEGLRAKVAVLSSEVDQRTDELIADATAGVVLWVQLKRGPLDLRGLNPMTYFGDSPPFDPLYPSGASWIEWYGQQHVPATPASDSGGVEQVTVGPSAEGAFPDVVDSTAGSMECTIASEVAVLGTENPAVLADAEEATLCE